MCHTVGFKHPGGYHDPVNAALWPKNPAPVDATRLKKHNEKLRGVGCESCHGPCSEHEKNPNNANLYPLINPFRPTPAERQLQAALDQGNNKVLFNQLFNTRMLALEQFCTKCHDHENDVHWGKPGTDVIDKWIRKNIVHRTPTPNNNGGNPANGPPLNNNPNPPGELKIDAAWKVGVPLIPEIRIDLEKK